MREELKALAHHRLARARETPAEGDICSRPDRPEGRFVKTGLVDADTARIIARAFAKRQMTDYADFTGIDVEEAREIRAKVAAFVEEGARVLGHLAATGDD